MLAEITVKIMWAAARIGSSLGRKEFVRLSDLRFWYAGGDSDRHPGDVDVAAKNIGSPRSSR